MPVKVPLSRVTVGFATASRIIWVAKMRKAGSIFIVKSVAPTLRKTMHLIIGYQPYQHVKITLAFHGVAVQNASGGQRMMTDVRQCGDNLLTKMGIASSTRDMPDSANETANSRCDVYVTHLT